MNPLAQFVRPQLVPETERGEGVYQLTDDSVSPTRLVRIDEDSGLEIEETVCALAKHAKFVDRDGNVCDVALRTGRVLSMEPEATRYEQVMYADLIRGQMVPLDACPNTLRYQHFKPGPLVDRGKGKTGADCGGRPAGCEHMLAVVEERRERARKKFDAQQIQLKSMSDDQAKQLMEIAGKAFGNIMAAASAASAKANLKADKGEADK